MACSPPSGLKANQHDRSETDPCHNPRAMSSSLGAAQRTGGASSVGSPHRRRSAVLRRALRHEVSRLRDRRRILAMTLLIITFGCVAAGVIAPREPAGADARASWPPARIWLGGGDPYRPTGPFLPYVYAPWMLPAFAPWAL